MALDGLILNKIVEEIKPILPCKINKIYQISNTELFFQLRSNGEKRNLLISCHSLYNRINITNQDYPTPEEPSNFVMFLRKHLDGSVIFDVIQERYDRYLLFKIASRNEIGDKIILTMSVELMGKYANVVLINEDNKIMDVLKRIPPFENNKRTLFPGAQFKTPEVQENKLDPYSHPIIDFSMNLTSQLQGFSPLLTAEVMVRIQNGEHFEEIMDQIKNSNTIYISQNQDEPIFHMIPLTHLNYPIHEYSIMEGLDALYFHKEEKDRIKQMTGDLFKLVRRELKHQRQKLPKLKESYDEALNCEIYREYGDYLQPYSYQITKGQKEATFERYDGEGTITIQLDPKLDGLGNAKKYFQKYNKGKKGQIHLLEQIELCEKEIEYFEGIEQQLEIANFVDAKEIRTELSALGYCKSLTSKIRKKKKQDDPHCTKIQLENGCTITFGKNNLQNEFLTFKLANKNDTWLHAKDYHGSHVTIDTDDPDEATLRLAANIAAYYSKGRYSSSVPINYCLVKQLKKVPGAKPGFVSLSSYKTIYIDPNEEEILNIIKARKLDR